MENTEAVNQIKEEMYNANEFKKAATIHFTPVAVDLESLSFDNEHVNEERKHEVTEEQAKQYIKNSDFSVSVWSGMYERYYGEKGASYVNTKDKRIRTAFSSSEFKENTKKLMEAYEN